MANQVIEMREARRWGNSCGVLVPREWLGKQVQVILVDRTEEIKKESFEILSPYLEDLCGIYLVGSYARNEQTPDSDIDIIAVSSSTKKVITSGKYNIQIFTLNGLKNTIKHYPSTIFPSILEAKAIMNKELLEELKSIEIKPEYFKPYFSDCKRIISINRGFIKKDRKKGNILRNDNVIYSAFLRIRGIYLMKGILEKKVYSRQDFINWIRHNLNIPEKEFEQAYEIYKNIRDNKKVNKHLSIDTAEKLIEFLEKEVRSYGKKKKKT